MPAVANSAQWQQQLLWIREGQQKRRKQAGEDDGASAERGAGQRRSCGQRRCATMPVLLVLALLVLLVLPVLLCAHMELPMLLLTWRSKQMHRRRQHRRRQQRRAARRWQCRAAAVRWQQEAESPWQRKAFLCHGDAGSPDANTPRPADANLCAPHVGHTAYCFSEAVAVSSDACNWALYPQDQLEGAGSPKCKVLPAHEPVLVEYWQNGGSVVWKKPMERLGVLGIVQPAEGGGAPLAIVGYQAVKGLGKHRLKILGGGHDQPLTNSTTPQTPTTPAELELAMRVFARFKNGEFGNINSKQVAQAKLKPTEAYNFVALETAMAHAQSSKAPSSSASAAAAVTTVVRERHQLL